MNVSIILGEGRQAYRLEFRAARDEQAYTAWWLLIAATCGTRRDLYSGLRRRIQLRSIRSTRYICEHVSIARSVDVLPARIRAGRRSPRRSLGRLRRPRRRLAEVERLHARRRRRHDPSRARVRFLLRRRARGGVRVPDAAQIPRPAHRARRRDHPQPARQRSAAGDGDRDPLARDEWASISRRSSRRTS